jgi:hypothetical protein
MISGSFHVPSGTSLLVEQRAIEDLALLSFERGDLATEAIEPLFHLGDVPCGKPSVPGIAGVLRNERPRLRLFGVLSQRDELLSRDQLLGSRSGQRSLHGVQ